MVSFFHLISASQSCHAVTHCCIFKQTFFVVVSFSTYLHIVSTLWLILDGFIGFPGGSTGKESACYMGDLGSIPELGRSPGKWKGYPLQYSALENSVDCSVQFSSVTQSCPTLHDPMICSTPGFPVHHQLLQFTQTHIHWVSDAIQPSHPLWSRSIPALNPSQHQSLLQWVNSSHQVAKVLEFQL